MRRPVRWVSDRTEAYVSDTQARDHVTTVSIALDRDGVVQALKVDTIANMGAYLSTFAPAIPSFFYAYPMPGPYKVRAVHCRVRAAFTNTGPVDAYRGAGRPGRPMCWSGRWMRPRGKCESTGSRSGAAT